MKQFFISFFANLAALLFVFGGPMVLITILLIASFSVSSQAKRGMISIERNSILVFDMSLNVTDSPEHANDPGSLATAFGGDNTRSVTLRNLTNAIKQATKDQRIKALFLTGSFDPAGFGTGYAALRELRDAIIDFQKTADHKQVYAYLENPTTRDYYVASTASTIYMNPYGEMEMPGLAVVKTYYKGFFDKFGINVQVTRVGKYKSAVEPFILTKMSDADREETNTLLGNIWGSVVDAVCKSRKIDPTAFQQLVDTDGYITAEHAKMAHLVDDTQYFGDVLKKLGAIAPASGYARIPLPFQQISIGDYIHASRKPKLPGESRTDNVVAVLYLEGEIVDGQGDPQTNIGGDRFAAELRQLQRDSDVKAVVLRVNSPGGSAYASEVILSEIRALHIKKPVIVSMGAYAASGGYWITTSSDRIFAEPNTITGSIGVFGMFMDVQKLGNDYGITWDSATTGKYADFNTISRPKTPEELNLAQGRVNDLYEKFLGKVRDSRKIPMDTLRTIAEGRVWSGEDALKLHLVDEMGGLSKAIAYAAEKVSLTDYKVKEYPERISAFDALAQLFTNQEEPVSQVKPDLLTKQYLRAKAELKTLQEFNDPLGAYARLPLGWDIR